MATLTAPVSTRCVNEHTVRRALGELGEAVVREGFGPHEDDVRLLADATRHLCPGTSSALADRTLIAAARQRAFGRASFVLAANLRSGDARVMGAAAHFVAQH